MTRMKKARRTKQSEALELAERVIALLPRRWRVKSLAELVPLAVLAFIAAAIYLFAQLADEILEGEALRFDETILRALRNPADLADPIGPRWLEIAMLDITALGGTAVLTLITAGVIGFLLMDRKRGAALFVLVAVGGGSLLTTLAKFAFARPRPELVAHLVDVSSYSFPSGHALSSAVTYLTLGALLARTQAHQGLSARRRRLADADDWRQPGLSRRALSQRCPGRLVTRRGVGDVVLASRALAATARSGRARRLTSYSNNAT
jgi:undecaprenyl-diphosphatase